MKFITYIINKLKPINLHHHLGRWKIETCDTKLSNKIDLSNEDHCGPCGQYMLGKLKSNIKNKLKLKTNISINKDIKSNKKNY